MTVRNFNNASKFQIQDIVDKCHTSILKRKSGYSNREIEIDCKSILSFLHLRQIQKMNVLKKDHETIFLPY